MRGTKAPTIVTVSPVTNPNRVAKASPARPNWLPPMEPETREAPSNRRKASWSTPRTTTESPWRTLRPRISGLTVTVQLDADRFDARLMLIDRAPEPCVIAKASPATTREARSGGPRGPATWPPGGTRRGPGPRTPAAGSWPGGLLRSPGRPRPAGRDEGR